jgi:hypothetical protein
MEKTKMEPITKLSKDIRKVILDGKLSTENARYLVDTYYQLQDYRLASMGQLRSDGENNDCAMEIITWLADQMETLENQIKGALDKYSMSHPAGVWARSIIGIGPVLAAGLLAHIPLDKTPKVANLWSYAGLNPEMKWEKATIRPYNAKLKVLCWKISESFKKCSSNPNDIYGKLYIERKQLETDRNDAGQYAEQAANILKVKKFSKTTEAYKWLSQGKLPPAQIMARAQRYAVKRFLSHYWDVLYTVETGKEPPLPYAIAILGHVDMMPVPNKHLLCGKIA